MSDLPSYHNKKEIPGDFSVVESSDKDEKGRRKIKIKIRKKMRTKTRVKKRSSSKLKSQSTKVLQVFLLILAVGALFYAGFQILVSDSKRPIVIRKKVIQKSE